jgi:hypothetical protein
VSKSIKQVLLGAAEYIEKYGWVQGRAGGPIGQMNYPACAYGAIDAASANPDPYEASELTNEVCEMLNEYLGITEPGANFIRFNDTPGRTASEVVALLRDAAEWAGSQEVAR